MSTGPSFASFNLNCLVCSSGVFETEPVEQAHADFAEFSVELTDDPRGMRKVWLFSFMLGNSRWLWRRLYVN